MIGIRPISDIPLEEMHLIDGGVAEDTIMYLLSLNVDKKKRPKKKASGKKPKLPPVTPKRYEPWERRIEAWRNATPKEFARKCSILENFIHWKMAQTRVFLMYYMIPLMFLDQQKNFKQDKMTAVLNLIRAYRLISGNTHEPVQDSDIEESRLLFRTCFKQMKRLTQGQSCSYKFHASTHLPDDAHYFQCHTGSLSAYPFENQARIFREVFIKFFL
jgi:hypothetical protein